MAGSSSWHGARTGLRLNMSFLATVTTALWLAQGPTPGVSLQREWVGVELAPLSMNLGSAPSGMAPDRFQPGFGGTVRLLRRAGERFYWTPLMVGLFVAPTHLDDTLRTSTETIFAHVQTEAGVRRATAAGTFELGLAAGAGLVSIPYANTCDGTCVLGAKGMVLSPVVRYLVRDRAPATVGVSLRAVLPLLEPHGELYGSFTGRATMFLLALDLGLGPS